MNSLLVDLAYVDYKIKYLGSSWQKIEQEEHSMEVGTLAKVKF
jgi:hypothetical protein